MLHAERPKPEKVPAERRRDRETPGSRSIQAVFLGHNFHQEPEAGQHEYRDHKAIEHS